jgi:hypothetical protein
MNRTSPDRQHPSLSVYAGWFDRTANQLISLAGDAWLAPRSVATLATSLCHGSSSWVAQVQTTSTPVSPFTESSGCRRLNWFNQSADRSKSPGRCVLAPAVTDYTSALTLTSSMIVKAGKEFDLMLAELNLSNRGDVNAHPPGGCGSAPRSPSSTGALPWEHKPQVPRTVCSIGDAR